MKVRGEVLQSCLEELESGRLTREECLARFADCRDELELLLSTAERFRQAPEVQPSSEFRSHARTRMLNLVSAKPSARLTTRTSLWSWLWSSRVLVRAGAILMAVFVLAGSGLAAASAAPPDSPLYPARLALEGEMANLGNALGAIERVREGWRDRFGDEAPAFSDPGQTRPDPQRHQEQGSEWSTQDDRNGSGDTPNGFGAGESQQDRGRQQFGCVGKDCNQSQDRVREQLHDQQKDGCFGADCDQKKDGCLGVDCDQSQDRVREHLREQYQDGLLEQDRDRLQNGTQQGDAARLQYEGTRDIEPGSQQQGGAQQGEPGSQQQDRAQKGEPGGSQQGGAQQGEPGSQQQDRAQQGEPGSQQQDRAQKGEPGGVQQEGAQHGEPGGVQQEGAQQGKPGGVQQEGVQHGEPGGVQQEGAQQEGAQNGEPGGAQQEGARNGEPGGVQQEGAQHGEPGGAQQDRAQHGEPDGQQQGGPDGPGVPEGPQYHHNAQGQESSGEQNQQRR